MHFPIWWVSLSHEFCASFAFLPSYRLCISKASQQKGQQIYSLTCSMVRNIIVSWWYLCILYSPAWPTKHKQTTTPISSKSKGLVVAEIWLILDAIRGNPAKKRRWLLMQNSQDLTALPSSCTSAKAFLSAAMLVNQRVNDSHSLCAQLCVPSRKWTLKCVMQCLYPNQCPSIISGNDEAQVPYLGLLLMIFCISFKDILQRKCIRPGK